MDAVAAGEQVVVCFYAEWCEPARTLARDLAEAAEPAVACRNVDVEKNPVVAARYDVDTLPTVVRFEDGAPVERVTGVPEDDDLGRLAGE